MAEVAFDRGPSGPGRRDGGGHPMGRSCGRRAAMLVAVPLLLATAVVRAVRGRR